MKNHFIPYELALRLKELAFNEECFGVYVNGNFEPRYRSRNSKFNPNKKLDKRDLEFCTAPLWQEAFDWFRLHKKLSAELTSWYGVDKFWKFEIFEVGNNNRENLFPIEWSESNEYHKEKGTSSIYTYEEAREACLEKLIELCKKD